MYLKRNVKSYLQLHCKQRKLKIIILNTINKIDYYNLN